MRLYLVRHGAALPDHLDPRRPLSEHGQQEVAKVAAEIISFYAAAVACLEGEGDHWRLAWMITPALCD